jgi:acetylornithine deacetylase/succinyl-diaminopimelate desuccinylase-like protein
MKAFPSRVFDYISPVLILTALASPGSARGQTCPDPAATTAGMELPIAAVRYLADDALEGRLAGSAGERCAAQYIVEQFERLGLVPAGEDGWFQTLSLASSLNPHAPPGEGRNVVARLEGSDPVLREQVVVVGAHYDHLGHGGFGSLAPDMPDAIHNGADDNASGVAAMLRTAQMLASGERPARSIIFIAFTGEESGLLGSEYFASHPTIAPDTIVAMINMDMVGRLSTGNLIVYGVDTANEWMSLLEPAAKRANVDMATRPEGYGPSDHTSFYTKDIPVLHFFTNVHGQYHRPEDDWDLIDAPGLETIATMVAEVARGVADRRPVLTLQRGVGAPSPSGGEGRGYGAYLGSVPDFTPVETGVRLSGVSPGSPAELAGLLAGDVIVRIGEHAVPDLEGMTDALRAHKPGDEVAIRFLRDGREVTVRLVLGTRGSGG